MARSKRKTKAAPVAGRVVVYDGLGPKQHTWLDEEEPCPCKGNDPLGKHPKGAHARTRHRQIEPGQRIEAGDLEDGSDRSRIIKGHLERGVCRFAED